MQRRYGSTNSTMSLDRGSSRASKTSKAARDEELALFHEMQKLESKDEHECHLARVVTSSRQRMATPSASAALVEGKPEDDLLTADTGKNDYDWLMTPPGTPPVASAQLSTSPPDAAFLSQRELPNLMRSLAAIKTSRLTNSRPDSITRRPDVASRTHSSNLHTSNGVTSRRPSVGSSSTPNSRSTTPTGRSSIPTFFNNRTTSVSSSRPTSSSRPSTPVRRPSTPSFSQTQSHAQTFSASRSTGVSRQSSVTSISTASSRGSSPVMKPRVVQPLAIPGFSLEPPPNLRTTMPARSTSNSRGRPGTPTGSGSSMAATTTMKTAVSSSRTAEMVPDRSRRSSSPSPSLSRGRSSTAERPNPSSSIMLNNGRAEINQPFSRGNKMADKMVPSRSSAPAASPRPGSSIDQSPFSQVKRAVRPTTPTGKELSAGYGRNPLRKSLDTTLRQLEIRQSPSNGLRSLIANTPPSSLYSVKSVNGRNWLSQSPMTTNSTASPDHSLNTVHDLEGSELGDDIAIEVGSKVSSIHQTDSLYSLTKDVSISSWIGSPDYRDNTVESIQPSWQKVDKPASPAMENVVAKPAASAESPAACQHGVSGNCELCNLKRRLWNLNQACKPSSMSGNLKTSSDELWKGSPVSGTSNGIQSASRC